MDFDVIIIGGGPGGYVAAIRAAQLGLRVACIEKRKTLGGTCLNVGCIPSKALLHSSEKFYDARSHLADHGIYCNDIKLDLTTMMARKSKVVDDLTKGIDFLFKKNKVERFFGTGSFKTAKEIIVTDESGHTQTLTGKSIIIATGSVATDIPGIQIDENRIVSSTGALSLNTVPKHLVVVGGGYIGLEMGSIWQRLGSKVTVVEYADRIVPMMDHAIGDAFQRILEKQGLVFHLSTKVLGVQSTKDELSIDIESGGQKTSIPCDVVLIAAGRKANTNGLNLDALGITPNERGQIIVNHHFETSVAGVYAIGDVIPGPMLAHKAEEEGIAVVEHIAGQKPHVNYDVIPAVVYTSPEVASVGKTEEDLKKEGIAYHVGTFPFVANSRSKAMGDTEGFVKILSHATTDRLLGVHIIGSMAGTMIAEAAAIMEFGGSSEDMARICHAHPTHSEALKEAAWATFAKAIHS